MKTIVTPREGQIWSMVVDGYSKKEIADKLNRSVHTINQTYRNLYAKLSIRKETDLVREWFLYHSFVTHQELKAAIKSHAAPAIILFLSITAAQVTFDTPAVRVVRTVNARSTSRPNTGRRKTYYS